MAKMQIEKTAKKWKLLQFLSLAVALFLGPLIFFLADANSQYLRTVGAILFFGGLFGWALSRFVAWWFHG